MKYCPKLILLSGTPGTGKTSVSKILKGNSDYSVFHLGNFIIENNLYTEENDGRDAKIIDTNKSAIEASIFIINNYFSMQENENYIIIDSHYSDIIIDGMKELLENIDIYKEKVDILNSSNYSIIKSCLENYSNGKNVFGIVLRCSPEKLEKRLNERKYKSEKIMENIQAEILAESIENMLEVITNNCIYEIDTSNYNINDTASILKSIFTDEKKMKEEFALGKINWLGQLNKNGLLNKYFPEGIGDIQDIKMVFKNEIDEADEK